MHLANGNIPVQRSSLPAGEAGVDTTVATMQKMAKGEYGARSAKIRALAINIVNAAGVADKDYYGMIVAIGEWVRDNIRYVRDPVGQETLSFPEETAFNSKAGDCLDENTRLLTPTGYKFIKDVRAGDTIQGRLGWTKVLATWDKGELPVYEVQLDNGGSFVATSEHRCFLLNGSETTVAELNTDDALLGPAKIELCASREFLMDDDFYFIGVYLADGWCDGNKTCIAGKDGFAKEAQKRWVKQWAEAHGWRTHWHARYLTVYIPQDHPLYSLVHTGQLAPDKEVPIEVMANLTPSKAARLLEGLLADSHHPMRSQRAIGAEALRKNPRRSGMCYSTTSHELAKQVRMLFRVAAGVSVRDTLVHDHGGLGSHPVHRIYPRFFRDKPARVDVVVPYGTSHVFDIQTEDQGIYLPDADVVVHNCDDKTILTAALLGSLGLQSYPVVVGMVPGHYSHVYLHAMVPTGNHRLAGKIVPIDAIMREWPIGREAEWGRIKSKKTYPHLAGLPMLGAYSSGPDYLDPRETPEQVAEVLASKITDTKGRGKILNTTVVDEPTEDLDALFSNPVLSFREAGRTDLYNRGPITAFSAKRETSYLESKGVRPLRPSGRPMAKRTVVEITDHEPEPVATAPTVAEFKAISGYLDGLAGAARAARGARGVLRGDPQRKVAAAAFLARQRMRQAKRVAANAQHHAMEMFAGINDLGGTLMQGASAEQARKHAALAREIAALGEAVARKAAAMANYCTGGNGLRGMVLSQDLAVLDEADLCGLGASVQLAPVDAGLDQAALVKIAAIAAALEQDDETLAGLGRWKPSFSGGGGVKSFFKKTVAAPKKIVQAVAKPVQQVAKQVAKAPKKIQQQVKKTMTKAVQKLPPGKLAKGLLMPAKLVPTKLRGKITRGMQTALRTAVLPASPFMARKAAAQADAGGGQETVYTDADGRPISKAEYDRLVAEASAAPVETAETTADQEVATESTDFDETAPAVDDSGSVVPQDAAPEEAFNYDEGGAPASALQPSMPGDTLAPPVDSFGPEDMGPVEEAESATSESFDEGGGGAAFDKGEAAESYGDAGMPEADGQLVDEGEDEGGGSEQQLVDDEDESGFESELYADREEVDEDVLAPGDDSEFSDEEESDEVDGLGADVDPRAKVIGGMVRPDGALVAADGTIISPPTRLPPASAAVPAVASLLATAAVGYFIYRTFKKGTR